MTIKSISIQGYRSIQKLHLPLGSVNVDEKTRFEIQLQMPGVLRALEARELSDGTLRYLCLIGPAKSTSSNFTRFK